MDDDPFQTQIDAIAAGKPNSTYAQALETYELTWAIREAGEYERELSAKLVAKFDAAA
jgi:hypothetical protein